MSAARSRQGPIRLRPAPGDGRPRARRQSGCEALEPRVLLAGDPLTDLTVAATVLVAPVDADASRQAMAVPLTVEAQPLAGTSTAQGFGPQELWSAYGFDQIRFEGGTIVGDGSGQTIAIVSAYHTPTAAADLAAFNARFGLPGPPSFVQVDQWGGNSVTATQGTWAQETALDVQWVHAFAPGADILLVEAASATFADLMEAVDFARRQPNVSVVSMSWGSSGEWAGQAGYNSYFTTPPGHDGVTFFAAAGNSGNPGGYPAYSPNVVAVGGTRLTLDEYNNILTETAWIDSGGGLSQYSAQPSWQHGVVTQSATKRGMPDVAFNASQATGVAVYDTFNNTASAPWTRLGGTSFATLAWAGLTAIANQGRALAGLPSFDMTSLMNALYAMPASNFNDIVTGSSGGVNPQAATPGYDLVTGRGSPKAQLIVGSLLGATSLAGRVFLDPLGGGAQTGLAGWTVYADLNSNGAYDAPAVNTIGSSDVHKTISSVGTPTVDSNLVVSGLVGRVLDVNVVVNVTHTNDRDLVLTLIAPDGTEVVLARHDGGTGDHFANTRFDDSAPVAIAAGAAPFVGSYRPTDALSALVNKQANGTWRLRIQDTIDGNGGALNAWALELTTGDPSAVSSSDGTYALGGLPDGTYQVRTVVQSGHKQTGPAAAFHTVALSAGEQVGGLDFGIRAGTVAGQYLFYNQSAFDGNNAAINAADDAAIALDKTAYFAGAGAITPASMSSYVRGLNGIMVDLDTAHGPISAADFIFRVSGENLAANNAPDTWTEAPAPAALGVRPGAGIAGTDRVEITWAEGAIANRYLQVTVRGNDAAGGFRTNTGLAASHTFYFGSRIGDSFTGTATVFSTSGTDEVDARNHFAAAASVTNLYDFDRNGFAGTANDQFVARSNFGLMTRLNLASPAAPLAAPTAAEPPLAPQGLTVVAAGPAADEPPDESVAAPPAATPGSAGLAAAWPVAAQPEAPSGALLAELWRRWRAEQESSEAEGGVDDALLALLARARRPRLNPAR